MFIYSFLKVLYAFKLQTYQKQHQCLPEVLVCIAASAYYNPYIKARPPNLTCKCFSHGLELISGFHLRASYNNNDRASWIHPGSE